MPVRFEHIRFRPPCGCLMAPLPLRCKSTGKRDRSFFSALTNILNDMTNPEKNCLLVNNSILQTGAPTPNGHRVTTSIVLRLVNVCIAFIALIVSGSADTSFPLFACIGWFISSIALMVSLRKEDYHC